MVEICDSEMCSKSGPSKDQSRLRFVHWLVAACWDQAWAECPWSQRARKVPGQNLSVADLQQLQRGLDAVRIFCFAVRL